MSDEIRAPTPTPDWTVVDQAKMAVQCIQWLVERGHVDEEDVEDAVEELKELIEEEIGKL